MLYTIYSSHKLQLDLRHGLLLIFCTTRNTFCGTWYLPHSRVHKSMTSGQKSDITIAFPDPDFI